MATTRRQLRQKGMAIALYGVMLISVVGFVGMAVDIGTIYMIKARLSAAVDAAALAAGRSADPSKSAVNTAKQFFAGNFPTGYFNSIGTPTVTPTLTQETDSNNNLNGVLDFQVTASVAAPTYFMNVFNVHSINVAATGTASRKTVVMVMVLDESSSMVAYKDPVTGLTACDSMKQAAGNFVNMFSSEDYLGVLPFDITAHTTNNGNSGGASPAQNQQALLGTLISNINCTSNTNTITALHEAYQWIKAVNLPQALNSIVLFTDGSPNGVTASFPVYTGVVKASDNRYGAAMNWDGKSPGAPSIPGQSSSSNPPAPGIANSCNDNTGIQDSNGTWGNALCINMKAVCTNAGDHVYGTISQTGGQNSYGAHTYGPAPPYDGATVTYGASCNSANYPGNYIRQLIAYIPDTDFYGNNLHGVVATGASPHGTVSNGLDTRDYWLFQTNNECSPDSNVVPGCKNVGDLWANYNVGMNSNFFPAGSTYAGKFRPDQPNSIVAASMNGTMDQANTIRKDTTYNIRINVIYLTGNGSDSVDREFLPILANTQWIIPLPYDSQYVAGATNPTQLYQNPAFQSTQQVGTYLVTADKNQLTQMFTQLASEALRLSH